jgi:cyclophilin family peptidyl-prolyl cis-trans isomerase
MNRNGFLDLFRGKGRSRRISHLGRRHRRAHFEALESRHLLSITLPTIANQTVLAGAPLNLGLDATNSTGNPVNYTVAVSNAYLVNTSVSNPQLTAVIPQNNPSLKLVIDDVGDDIHGQMILQLYQDLAPKTVDKIMTLTNSGFYDGLTFHRIIKDFMIQGGDPSGDGTGGPGFQFDDEFNPALQFTGPGVLAMANSGDDTNGSQFFITVASYRYGDFQYTIFGGLTEGSALLQQLQNVATNSNDKPLSNVIITDASIITDSENALLRLSVPDGTTGYADVTVTATDSVTSETTSRTFHVTVSPDTNDNQPFLGAVNPIQTNANTPVSFTIPATDLEGNAIYYYAGASPTNANLTVSVDSATGYTTVTPTGGISGAYALQLAVRGPTSSLWDAQLVPLYINPAAPTSISLVATSDTGSSNSDRLTNLNNTAGKTLQFEVGGVVTGATVQLYADGVLLGTATAAGTSVVVTTNGSLTLANGTRSITAKQTLANQTVDVGNLQTAIDLASDASAVLTITVDTAPLQFTSTPAASAVVAVPYSSQVTVDSTAAGTTYQLAQAPTGMTINAGTGLITWTPTDGQAGAAPVTVLATDAAGNTAQQPFTINVLASNHAPVLTAASPLLGSTDENTSTIISLTTFINNGAGTTIVTDVDGQAVLGGIALVDTSGNGTWAYSLDSTTFIDVGTVSAASALLLPSAAKLRYTPNNQNGETAGISYRAWDATNGANGARVDLSQTDAVGGITAYSLASDAASLIVTVVNDAPVLTAANPVLGNVVPGIEKIVDVAAFINQGAGSTTITDVDANAVVGGIALVGATGNGSWKYSLDGTTFTSVGTLSATSSLLLPKTAKLSYTTNDAASLSATVTYRAWDAASGQSGAVADVTTNGGATAFSANTDTASFTVATGSISGFVYIDVDNDGLRLVPNGSTHSTLQGVVVELWTKNAEGNWTEVAGKSPVMTGADGSYRFELLVPGTYQVREVQPTNYLDGRESLGTVAGVVKGSAANDQFEIQLGGAENAREYNFGERGLKPTMISLRSSLASTPMEAGMIVQINTAPVVHLTASTTASNYSTTFKKGDAPVAIAAPSATIVDADSPKLASMNVTIVGHLDAAFETLAANTTGTPITAQYADGLLTLSGVADRAAYQQVLRTVTYSNTATTPSVGTRTIQVVVNDGISDSDLATSTVVIGSVAVPSLAGVY